MRVMECFALGCLLGAAASAADVSFTGTVNPACFTLGAEGKITVKATNTLGHPTDALVLAACGAFEGSAQRPTWLVEKTSQNATDPLKLPTVFPYEFDNQNCIRAQPAAPGGNWPAGTTESVTFTYRAPASLPVAVDAAPGLPQPTKLIMHYTAWSQEQPRDKEVTLSECGKAPHLTVKKFLNHEFGIDWGYYIVVINEGSAPTVGDITVVDRVPSKLKIKRASLCRGLNFTDAVPITPSGQDGQTVEARITSSLPPGAVWAVFIDAEPKPGVTGGTLNSAFLCGGGDPGAPCSNPLESNVVSWTLKKPSGPPPAAQVSGPAAASAGSTQTYVVKGGSVAANSATAPASGTSYAWFLSDNPLTPAALGPTLVHTFVKPGAQKVSLVAFANEARTTDELAVQVAAAPATCAANPTTLCLLGGRFKVQVDWQALNNSTVGVGTARPITSDTGSFWFFNDANLELIVKLIDGRGLNGKFWVFFGALTDVQYQIKVTDTTTGEVRQYVNRQGYLTSFADTKAFPIAANSVTDLAAASGWTDDPQGPQFESLDDGFMTSPQAATSCIADPGTKKLCLSDRFDVSVTCSAPGTACTPNPVKLTTDTGYFWFFNSANIELMTKVVDGRGLNGKFWFFYGALSDVQYQIHLRDRVTGAFKDYSNAQGSLASVADTSALPGQ